MDPGSSSVFQKREQDPGYKTSFNQTSALILIVLITDTMGCCFKVSTALQVGHFAVPSSLKIPYIIEFKLNFQL